MPSVSKKQHNFMNAIAHNKAFAKKVGVPQSVGKDFSEADKGKKFRKGGETMATNKLFRGKETKTEELREAKALRMGAISPKEFVKGEKSEGHKEENSAALAKKIKSGKMSPAAYAKMESKEKYSCGGKVKKMADGGGTSPFGTTPLGGTPRQQILGATNGGIDIGGMTPAYGGGNQGGAFGGLQNVNQGANQIGQSLGTIQGALGVGGGANSTQNVGSSQAMYKKGGKVKTKKMAMGGAPVDPRAAAMAAKQAAMAAPMGAKRGMPMARPQAPQMAGMPQGKPMVGRMPPQANMPVPTMKKGGMTKMGAVKTKPGNINGVAKTGLTKGKVVKMARGGGIEVRGKTKGTMVKMKGC
jgi:hypothetical protein